MRDCSSPPPCVVLLCPVELPEGKGDFFLPFHCPVGSASLYPHFPVKESNFSLKLNTKRPFPLFWYHQPLKVLPERVASILPGLISSPRQIFHKLDFHPAWIADIEKLDRRIGLEGALYSRDSSAFQPFHFLFYGAGDKAE